MKPHSQRGVALVITLVMLAVVTLMAITFLAVSRRERSAVAVSEEQNMSRAMAEAATARAQAEVVAQMLAQGSPYAYGLLVSTNFISPAGFDPNIPWDAANVTNVNYDHLLGNSVQLLGRNRLRNIANLMLDARAPVFVSDGTNHDFRFFLDLNRNGRFETNGLQPVLGANGRPLRISNVVQTAVQVGDPEWIGVLQRPEYPHSATNRFVGRYAYLVLPAGKSLDWNFVHNHARLGVQDRPLNSIGFYRNQGVGSWELNLAAFLKLLNTNAWPGYDYRGLQNPTPTESFFDALQFLRYRYDGNLDSLASAQRWFFNTNDATVASRLTTDFVDLYTDGPPWRNRQALTTDNDRPERPWPGSDSPNTFVELNDLFATNKAPAMWTQRLLLAQSQLSSYDRYTFYRMLGQMGMDSAPATEGKVHLNYDNLPPYHATNMVPWVPGRFFEAVADRLIKTSLVTRRERVGGTDYVNTYLGEKLVRPDLSVTKIQVYPRNDYTPALHRLLQVALNLYDASTNRALTAYPHVPTVMRPTFLLTNDAVFIKGYVEVEDANFVRNLVPLDLVNPADRAAVTRPNAVVYNVPFVVGAKKGWPNMNEVGLLNVAQMIRKVELRKEQPGLPVAQTNLLYFLTISNRFGIEGWNSYTQDFRRPLEVIARGTFQVGATGLVETLGGQRVIREFLNEPYGTNQSLALWPSNKFELPVARTFLVLSNAFLNPGTGRFQPAGTNLSYPQNLGFYAPQLTVSYTNRFYYAVIDTSANRLVDFVCLGNMTSALDVSRELAGRPALGSVAGSASEPPNAWLTNRVGSSFDLSTPTLGIQNQIDISLGNIPTSSQQWRSWSQVPAEGDDKEKSIDRLRLFCGLTPLVYTTGRSRQALEAELQGRLALEAGYTPTRKFYQDMSWQANDPLVHYTLGDLLDPSNSPSDPGRTNTTLPAIPPQKVLTNANLLMPNQRYRPWGGNPNQSSDRLARDLRVKDPLIYRSDDWDFPTNKYPNLGWIGRVHRGTPWQTVYLKADLADPRTNNTGTSWFHWAGSTGSHPTNDWALVDLFTTAANDNAARGLLSVNQSHAAAWAAVLGGVNILLPTDPEGGVRDLFLEQTPTNLFEPAAAPIDTITKIVDGINRTRMGETNRVPGGLGAPYFDRLGRVLATPELTFATSLALPDPGRPLLRNLPEMGRDEVVERIPQQVLSLLKADEPRFVVYAFGQTLKEAPSSLNFGEGVFNRLCTNYQVKSEFVSKSVIRIDGPLAKPRAVIESFNELTTE